MPQSTNTRIEEKRYWLAMEKCLATHHRSLSLKLDQLRDQGDDEAAEACQAALWSLGVAILQVARTQNAI